MERTENLESSSAHLQAMMRQESKYWETVRAKFHSVDTNPYHCSHLERTGRGVSGFAMKINETWRKTMCQWYFEFADWFDIDRRVVSIALNYLDRVIAATLFTDRFASKEEFQLAAITTLYIASKLHGEIEPPPRRSSRCERKKLRIEAFVILSNNQFDVSAIESMERTLLSILNWQLNPPEATGFVECMLLQMPDQKKYHEEWKSIFEIARYMAELSLGDSNFSFQYKPSVIAVAAILCAINSLQISGRSLPPIDVLECLSDRIAQATLLRLDSPVVMDAASRLTCLCPSIFVKTSRRKRKGTPPKDPSKCDKKTNVDGVSLDEIVGAARRKTSPICVSSFNDDALFFATRRRHKR